MGLVSTAQSISPRFECVVCTLKTQALVRTSRARHLLAMSGSRRHRQRRWAPPPMGHACVRISQDTTWLRLCNRFGNSWRW